MSILDAHKCSCQFCPGHQFPQQALQLQELKGSWGGPGTEQMTFEEYMETLEPERRDPETNT